MTSEATVTSIYCSQENSSKCRKKMKYSGQYYLSSTSSYHCTLCFSETEITPLFFLFQFDISPLSTFFLEKAAIMESGHATSPPPPRLPSRVSLRVPSRVRPDPVFKQQKSFISLPYSDKKPYFITLVYPFRFA